MKPGETDTPKARQRLEAALSAEQLATLRGGVGTSACIRYGANFVFRHYFEVISDLGNRWVINCIPGGHMGNVMRADSGRAYCAQVFDPRVGDCCEYPDSDHWLAQALWLRTDEAGFLKKAR